MIHYLRFNNKTIVDCETTNDDLRVVVCIRTYSSFLLDKMYHTSGRNIIEDFNDLQKLRGEFFERLSNKNKKPAEFVAERFRCISNKYRLEYVTD